MKEKISPNKIIGSLEKIALILEKDYQNNIKERESKRKWALKIFDLRNYLIKNLDLYSKDERTRITQRLDLLEDYTQDDPIEKFMDYYGK